MRKPDRPPFLVGRPRIARRERLAQQRGGDAIPFAAIAARAERLALVLLRAVVERRNRRIGDDAGVAVPNDDRGARKDETMVRAGTGVAEQRIIGGAAEPSDADVAALEDDLVGTVASPRLVDVRTENGHRASGSVAVTGNRQPATGNERPGTWVTHLSEDMGNS